jgi:hypothetical protein
MTDLQLLPVQTNRTVSAADDNISLIDRSFTQHARLYAGQVDHRRTDSQLGRAAIDSDVYKTIHIPQGFRTR